MTYDKRIKAFKITMECTAVIFDLKDINVKISNDVRIMILFYIISLLFRRPQDSNHCGFF